MRPFPPVAPSFAALCLEIFGAERPRGGLVQRWSAHRAAPEVDGTEVFHVKHFW
jgi:hypothetical protein